MSRTNPVTGVVQPHWGIDLVGWSTVVSPANGTIIFAGYNGGEGNSIHIRGDNGDVYKLFHNARFLRTGGRVSQGEGVAIMGTTGQSTGVHCHFQTHPGGGQAINPRVYMGAGSGAGTGSADLNAGQRTVGASVCNRRTQPTSQSALAGDPLQPGTVGNFVGWIHGETVSGNNVWYKGTSGHWFWSGAFVEGANGTGLANLNASTPPALSAGQRRATTSLNGRSQPNTSGSINQTLEPGTAGDFNGWITGEAVEGESRWLRGAHSGDWFWLGGLEPKNTDGLPDLNTGTPPPAGTTRTVGAGGSNGRSAPNTSAAIKQTLAPGTVGEFNGWTVGQEVEGNSTWFHGAISGDWFWSGGFTSTSTDGLPKIDTTTPTDPPPVNPNPVTPDNPRGLPVYAPVYPGAKIGLVAPLGDGSRLTKGNPAVAVPEVGIDRYIIHHTATTVDQADWFSYKNDRSSCPTFYMRADGSVLEFIRPKFKPAATGPEWNYRSLATETLNATSGPAWLVTDAQAESHAQIIAWLASYDGKELDGIPVRFKIDLTHVITHKEALPGTECPGPNLQSRIPSIVARAKVIYAEKYAPTTPVDPPPVDMVEVPRKALEAVIEVLQGFLR
jgi:hypothetical protein